MVVPGANAPHIMAGAAIKSGVAYGETGKIGDAAGETRSVDRERLTWLFTGRSYRPNVVGNANHSIQSRPGQRMNVGRHIVEYQQEDST